MSFIVACVPAAACTNFMATDGEIVLFGDSEDAGLGHPLEIDPESAAMFFFPAVEGQYGRMHLGWLWQGTRNSYQAGMNDQGLAYGLTAVPRTKLTPHPERRYEFGQDPFFDRLISTSANVEEAIEFTFQFSFEECWFQLMIADTTGNAVVIGPGDDGELAVTRKKPADRWFVASTFNLADSTQYVGKDSFKRYEDAETLFAEIVNADNLSAQSFAQGLDVVHRQGAYGMSRAYTMYSTAYDLTNRTAYTYFMSQFDEVVHTDLSEELAKGSHVVRLTDLFSDDLTERALAEYSSIQTSGFLFLGAEIAVILALLGAAAYWLGGLILESLR